MTTYPVQDAPEALTIVQHLKTPPPFAQACAAMPVSYTHLEVIWLLAL